MGMGASSADSQGVGTKRQLVNVRDVEERNLAATVAVDEIVRDVVVAVVKRYHSVTAAAEVLKSVRKVDDAAAVVVVEHVYHFEVGLEQRLNYANATVKSVGVLRVVVVPVIAAALTTVVELKVEVVVVVHCVDENRQYLAHQQKLV